MFRSLLRSAGITLDTDEPGGLARAAAAAGVVAASLARSSRTFVGPSEGALRRRLERELYLQRALWQPPTESFKGMPASQLAQIWKDADGESARMILDIEVLAASNVPVEQAIGAFMRDACPNGSVTGMDSGVTEVESTGPSGRWGSPLRIGVLASAGGLAVACPASALVRQI